jgi:hypothetical protein
MNTNTIEITNAATQSQIDLISEQHDQAIRVLADAELFLVGGGSGEVTWNTPNP